MYVDTLCIVFVVPGAGAQLLGCPRLSANAEDGTCTNGGPLDGVRQQHTRSNTKKEVVMLVVDEVVGIVVPCLLCNKSQIGAQKKATAPTPSETLSVLTTCRIVLSRYT